MGWVDSLRGTVVGVDTMPLIYFLEEHPTYLPVVDPFFAAIGRNEFTIVTSTISLLVRACDKGVEEMFVEERHKD